MDHLGFKLFCGFYGITSLYFQACRINREDIKIEYMRAFYKKYSKD